MRREGKKAIAKIHFWQERKEEYRNGKKRMAQGVATSQAEVFYVQCYRERGRKKKVSEE